MDENINVEEILDSVVEKSVKGTLIRLQEINEELKKDITDNKKLELLIEQNQYIKNLLVYFDKK